jgi:hypothetical protein
LSAKKSLNTCAGFSRRIVFKKIIFDILSNYFAKRGNRLLTAKRNFTRHHIYIYVKKAAKMKKKTMQKIIFADE